MNLLWVCVERVLSEMNRSYFKFFPCLLKGTRVSAIINLSLHCNDQTVDDITLFDSSLLSLFFVI